MKHNRNRSIVFVTGTRADFGKLEPLASAAYDAGMEVRYFITGMHMNRRYGLTKREVRRHRATDFYEFVNQSDNDAQEFILSKTISGFSDWISELDVDLVIVHGDRVEALAVAMYCAMNYVPCAHIEGGEVSGTIDEIYRHCNTKLCRYHFVSSDQAAARVIALGECPDDVFVVGSPELDRHKISLGVDIQEVKTRYDINFSEYGIALFHPVTSEIDTIGDQAKHLFEAMRQTERSFVVIAPNNDPGSKQIFNVLDRLPQEQFKIIPSMRFAHFSELMKHSALVIGNSSLGVREAPFLGIPSVNVGTRQHNRSNSSSISHISAFHLQEIKALISKNWGKRYPPSDQFGSGNSVESFISIISDNSFWERGVQKVFYE